MHSDSFRGTRSALQRGQVSWAGASPEMLLVGRTGVKGVGVGQWDGGHWPAFPLPASAHLNKWCRVKLWAREGGDPGGESSEMISRFLPRPQHSCICRGTLRTRHALIKIPREGSRKAVLQLRLNTLGSPR